MIKIYHKIVLFTLILSLLVLISSATNGLFLIHNQQPSTQCNGNVCKTGYTANLLINPIFEGKETLSFKERYETLFVNRFIFKNTVDDNGVKTSNTVYVDDDNKDGPWDGSLLYPYQHIQDALDHANPGDFIMVYPGIYYEHLLIQTDNITLYGLKKEETIIDGMGHGRIIQINSNYIQVKNFTIINGTYGLWIQSSFTIIDTNDIDQIVDGIWLQSSSNSLIKHNTVSNATYDGIVIIHSSNNNMITQNDIKKSGYDGIVLYASSNHNVVIENRVIENTFYGIAVDDSHDNVIKKNTIQENMYCGIILNSSTKNMISNNNFIENKELQAYFLQFNSIISGNTWNENYWDDWQYRFPRPIFGKVKNRFWMNFDWHPEETPYHEDKGGII